MNGIIAMCHFCEMHGPSILFLTQTFHDHTQPSHLCANEDLTKKMKPYYGKPEYIQRTAPSTPTANSAPTSPKISDTCDACRCKPIGHPDLVCNDHKARVSYISSQHPYHPEIFSIVRQACVRSLSCEVCPGREGPIFFGDDSRGHVLSHTFFLKDSQARGFHRWYSIIVIMMDKIYLLNLWPFLVKQLKKVIDELKEKANKVYESEQAKCCQRALRLSSVTETTPGNFRRQRGSTKIMRSLSELTKDDKVFPHLHQWFTWILQSGGNRLTEKLLEGLPTEDSVVDWEKQEELQDGFVNLNTKPIIPEHKDCESSSGLESEDDFSNFDTKDCFVIKNIRHLFKFLGEDTFRILAYHAIIGNQLIMRGSDRYLISSVIAAMKSLLPKGCFRPIYYSSEYEDSWKCNFIGIPVTVSLQPHVEASKLHVVVEVTNDVNRLSEEVGASAAASFSLGYDFNVKANVTIPDKLPQVMLKMWKAIQDTHISDRVLEYFFISLKEEWMNKVKVLFKFSRAGSRSKDETQKLLAVLGAQDHDTQLLKFWMTGLSTQYKTHVLSATMQSTNIK